MRAEILAYLQSLTFTSYVVSSELPFSSNGTELYLKNAKRIYVDTETVDSEPFIGVMDSMRIDQEITTVNIYFTNDAKTLPADYNDTVNKCRNARYQTYTNHYMKNYSDIQTDYKNDLLVTKVELRFTRITTT